MASRKGRQPLKTALAERVKELTCLFGLSRLAQRPDLSLPELLQGVADLVPPAWQFPDRTCCRVTLDGDAFVSAGFQESPLGQRVDLVIGGEARGSLEVFCRESGQAAPFLDEEWNLLEGLGQEVARAIERRRLEQDREHLLEQVRHMDRLATVGQFASGLAHELNEPLCSILGLAQLAVRDPGLSSQAQADLRKIVSASLHAREVIKGFLALARAGKPQRTPIPVNPLVTEAVDLFRVRCAREKITIRLHLASGLPRIRAVPSQMRQVLANLIVNGIQAMPHGGTLRLRTHGAKGTVRFSVADTGIGMDDATIRNIFTPFFTTKDAGEGTGLGLGIVQDIIASHGGKLRVESRPGLGSRFIVELPANEGDLQHGQA